MIRTAFIVLCAVFLAACREDTASDTPNPVAMTDDVLGYYCQMALAEHPGPKAQVHLKGIDAPIHFSQVRDAIAYLRLPEQSHAIAAIYVNDMAAAPNWDDPGADNWIAATGAHFVVGSRVVGGMDAPEVVPFSDRNAALDFAAENGGQVVQLGEIRDVDVLQPDQVPDTASSAEQDFIDRLRSLSDGGQG